VADTAFGDELGAGTWNISAADVIADYPSPGQFFSFLTCTSVSNGGAFCDPPLDRLAARAARLQLRDPAAAQALWARADRRAVDLAAWAPMVSNASVELLSPRTEHFTLDASSGPQIDQLWIR
jgi:ABC-type oligopeptide transport system substrate-binding subunit